MFLSSTLDLIPCGWALCFYKFCSSLLCSKQQTYIYIYTYIRLLLSAAPQSSPYYYHVRLFSHSDVSQRPSHVPPAAPLTQPSVQGSFYFTIITFSGTPQSTPASHLHSFLAAIHGQSSLSFPDAGSPDTDHAVASEGKSMFLPLKCLPDFKYRASNFPNCPTPKAQPLWMDFSLVSSPSSQEEWQLLPPPEKVVASLWFHMVPKENISLIGESQWPGWDCAVFRQQSVNSSLCRITATQAQPASLSLHLLAQALKHLTDKKDLYSGSGTESRVFHPV